MRRGSSFTPVDRAAEGLLRRVTKGESSLLWLRARWPRIVGEPLSRKIQPAELSGKRLTLTLLDPSWRNPVEAIARAASDPAYLPKSVRAEPMTFANV